MAVYTPLSDATVEAVQWQGQWTDEDVVPAWLNNLGAHAPTDGTLHVTCWNGTFAARIGEWIVKGPTGDVNVVPDAAFAATYNVDDVAVEETKRTAAERAAEAAELRAAAAKSKHEAAVATAKGKDPAPTGKRS